MLYLQTVKPYQISEDGELSLLTSKRSNLYEEKKAKSYSSESRTMDISLIIK